MSPAAANVAWRVARLSAVAFALVACGPAYGEPFVRAFFEAKRAYNAGRYEEAAHGFEQAAQVAQRVKDRDEAYFLKARMYERLDRFDEAAAVYRHMLQLEPPGPRRPRAAFELAEHDIERGDAAAGWQALGAAVDAYPAHGSARRGLTRVAEHLGETQGEAAAQAYLRTRLDTLKNTGAEQHVKYELAHSLWRSSELLEAHAMFLRAAREHPYPRGSLTDDAYWNASLVAEELGDYVLAIEDLRAPLTVRESGGTMSYERPRFPAMQMRIAELYRDRLGDLTAARRELRVTFEQHADALLADDALWEAARLARQMNDLRDACGLMGQLGERFPRSRYNRCTAVMCPTEVAPPEAAGGPCPDYIRRTLEQ